MPSAGCFITGTGLVTCQGITVEENWRSLLAGRVLHGTGMVPIPRNNALPRVSQIAIEVARQAIQSAGGPALNDGRTALVVGTSKGPIEDWIDQLNGVRPPDVTLGIARVAADVATAVRHTGGARLTYAGACASGLHALIRAAEMVRTGECDRALVVAAEASTHALFEANFSRLGVLADPADGCRPFDRRRHGFLLAEAAAAVWLTNEPGPNAVKVDAGVVLADANHLTGTDRDGRSLREVVRRLAGRPIDAVHAHGTGTILNDAVEWAALETIRQAEPLEIYSHKHAIGHTQGAAGLIAIVLNTEMHCRREIPGNANTSDPMHVAGQNGLRLSQSSVRRDVTNSIAIAAGFGGTIAGVRLAGQ